MTETRAITFRKFSSYCNKRDFGATDGNQCYYYFELNKHESPDICTAANCPIWKGLKVIERQ